MRRIEPKWLYVEVIDDTLPRAGVSGDIMRHVVRVPLTEEQAKMLSYINPTQILRAISVQLD